MKSIMLLATVLVFSGCTSLQTKVFEQVSKGDSKADVIEALGEPDSFEPVGSIPNGEMFDYRSGAYRCAVELVSDVVVAKGCVKDQSYHNKTASAIGLMMQGAGSGLQRAGATNVNCTSNTYGTATYTNCN